MRPLKSLAICMVVCGFMLSLMAAAALAEGGWGDPGQKGKPDYPPHQSVGPTYYGQPMMLDADPWIDPPKKGKLEPVIQTMSPLAWWMQPALDDHPWDQKPEPGKPEPE